MKLSFTTKELHTIALALQNYQMTDEQSDLIEYIESARESEGPVYQELPDEADFKLNPNIGLLDKARGDWEVTYMTDSDNNPCWVVENDGEVDEEFETYDELKAWWEALNNES